MSKPPVLAIQPPPPPSPSAETHGDPVPTPTQPTYVTEEQQTTAASLKAAQVKMEAQVYAIWTNLSAFEESSAACISDMLTHVSAGVYLDAIRMAEKFILHVEVLFAAIDEIEERFAGMGSKGASTSCLPHASSDSWHWYLCLSRHVACSGGSDAVS